MDIILEITVQRLRDLVRQKVAQQGVAPDIQVDLFADRMVLNGVAVTELNLWVPELVSRPWNRPLVGPALDPFTFISMQRVRGRIGVQLRFTKLTDLRAHRPDSPSPPSDTTRISIDVIFEPVVRVTSGAATLSIDVQDVSGIHLPVPDDATDEQRRAMAEQERALHDRALGALRAAARGLDVGLPINVLGQLVSGATEVLNAAVVVDTVLTDRGAPDPNHFASFLQVGVQVVQPEWERLNELRRAELIARKSDELRSFHRLPVSRADRADFAMFISAEAIVAATTAIVHSSVASAPDRLSLRGEIAGSWGDPAFAVSQGNVVLSFPVTAMNACGTGHHLDADVTARIRFAVLTPDRIQLGVVLDYAADGLALAGCALEVGGIGAFIGLVIGGVFGGWVGALVGAIVGFLIGFIGVLFTAAFYRAELGTLPSSCEENVHHDVHCTFRLPPAGADPLLGALRLLRAVAMNAGLAIQGNLAFPPPGPPPRLEATVLEPLHWRRLDRRGWVMAGRIYMTNIGGGNVMVGSAVAMGPGSELYWNRLRYPGVGISSRSAAYVDIEVPRAEVEAARSAGTLAAAEVLIFSSGGARVVRFPEAPEPLSEAAIQLADTIDATRIEIDRLGRDYGVLGTPFPPIPDPRLFAVANPAALLQAAIRFGNPGEQWALATAGGQVLDHTVVDQNGNAWLAHVTAEVPDGLRLVQLPSIDDQRITETVKQLVDNAAAFNKEVAQNLQSALENAMLPELADPLAGTAGQMAPVIDVGLERPAVLSKIDIQQLRDVIKQLADKFGTSGRKVGVDMRTSLLAETSRVPCKHVESLEPAAFDGRTLLAATIDGMRYYLGVDLAGQAYITDASPANAGAQPGKPADSPSIPIGFARHSGYLVGQVRGLQNSPPGLSILALIAQTQ